MQYQHPELESIRVVINDRNSPHNLRDKPNFFSRTILQVVEKMVSAEGIEPSNLLIKSQLALSTLQRGLRVKKKKPRMAIWATSAAELSSSTSL
jgi:hypothetical protein